MGSKLCYMPRNIWLSIFCAFETVCVALRRKFVVIFERGNQWETSKNSLAILVKSVAMLLMSAKKQSTFFLFARYSLDTQYFWLLTRRTLLCTRFSWRCRSSAKSRPRVLGGNRTGNTCYLQHAWCANILATSYPLLWIQNAVANSLRINNDAASQYESLSVRHFLFYSAKRE